MNDDNMPRNKEVPDEKIVAVLRECDDPVMTTKEISDQLPMTRQGVANRLEFLEKRGLVCRKKPDRDVFYWVED